MLRVPELPQELTPITAPGSTSARQHPCTTSGTHANKINAGLMQDHVKLLIPTPLRPTTLSTRPPLAHPSVATLPHATTPGRLVGHRRLGRSLPTTQRAAVRRGHTCQSWAWHLDQAAGRDRGEQGWQKRSRAIAIAIMRDQAARYLRLAPQRCAPLVLSGSSQEVKHLDLEPEPVEKTKVMWRGSRRSHPLRRKERERPRSGNRSGTQLWREASGRKRSFEPGGALGRAV